MSDQWTLFGLDLRRIASYIRLGVHQLLWGTEAGIRRRFAPIITVLPQPETATNAFSDFGLVDRPHAQGEPLAVIVPNDLTLSKVLQLPMGAEFELATAVHYEAMSSSPFADGDTVFGWQIISRENEVIELALVLASRAAISAFASAVDTVSTSRQPVREMWSYSDGQLIQIRGFGESFREDAYINGLYQRALRGAVFVLGALLVISLPAMIIQLRASQLEDLATRTEVSAGPATEAKNRLVELEEKLNAAVKFSDDRLYYHAWLHKLAQATPNAVYLTRLGLDGDRLTISGLAANAAEYQTLLADTGFVKELSAPAAFTRDARAGRERFTLTMRIDGVQ